MSIITEQTDNSESPPSQFTNPVSETVLSKCGRYINTANVTYPKIKYFIGGLILVVLVVFVSLIFLRSATNSLATNSKVSNGGSCSTGSKDKCNNISACDTLGTQPQEFVSLSDTSSDIVSKVNMINLGDVSKSKYINQYRPYQGGSGSHNFFGVFESTNTKSFYVSVTQSSGVDVDRDSLNFETAIFRYPDWTMEYSCLNEVKLDLDFLKPGNYSVFVFSPKISGVNLTAALVNKPRYTAGLPQPPISFRPLKKYTLEALKSKDDTVERIVNLQATTGTESLFKVDSETIELAWPSPKYMRIEKIYFTVPENTTEIYTSVPAYGALIESSGLAEIVHESDSAIIYRTVAEKDKSVSIVCAFPGIDPSSEVSIAPTMRSFVFGA